MTLSSYSGVFGLILDRDEDEIVAAGDIVRTGANLFPHYEVLAVHGDKAWVRNVSTGVDHLALVSRCRRIEERIVLAAAE
jgi:hypothetical protein